MILIDSNALVVLLVGLMDVKLLSKHKRTSNYEEQDYYDLQSTIGDVQKLTVLPQVWAETDNLLNNFTGEHSYMYIQLLKQFLLETTERYVASASITEQDVFQPLGITDCLLLSHAIHCEMLITSDSRLADYATSYGINVYDLVKHRNERA